MKGQILTDLFLLKNVRAITAHNHFQLSIIHFPFQLKEGIVVKKRVFVLIALALVMALLSGCHILPVLMSASDGAQTKRVEAPMMVEEDAVYEMYSEEVEPDGMPMPMPRMSVAATSMPNMVGAASMNRPIQGFNTEEYASVTENGFRNVATSPLSTFSADVDTASYCNLRRMLNDGYRPAAIPSGAVRVEEMLNYFRYDYAAPTDGSRFGVTARIGDCPWNEKSKLLMLGVRAADAPEQLDEGSNLVFLIDVSGSMYPENKLGLVKRALTMLSEQLTAKDTLSICTYAAGERVLLEGANPETDRAKIMAALDALYADGSTNGQRGLEQAYELAMKYYRPKGNNRVIMCSDGDLNVGITSQSELHDYVSKKKETGVYLSVLGFGEGNYKDTKMETLADDGNGNYYYIDSILEARKVLLEELTQSLYAVADDVKFQIEFNPAKVAAWRQVGYENRALANEDFENDAKDAGEVGAGASVTVLYELIPAEGAQTDSGLKYQTGALTEAAQGGEWLTLSIRYKEPGGSESKLETRLVGEADVMETPSEDFLFAAAVAEFGMILNQSEYIGNSSYESALDLLKQTGLGDEYREELFSLVKIAQRAEQLGR